MILPPLKTFKIITTVEMCIFDWESDSKKKTDTFITTTAQNVFYCKIFSSSELEKNFGYKNMAIELGAPVSNELNVFV